MNARLLLVSAAVLAALVALPRPLRAEKLCAWAIPSEMVDRVASAKARAGQAFTFRTTADAVAASGVRIPAGTLGYGLIRAADAAGRHDHDGMVAIEPRYLVVRTKRGEQRVEVAMNPTLPVTWTPSQPLIDRAASHVPLPVPGLVMSGVNTLRWGRNVTLGPGFMFSVIPVDDLATGPIC